MLEYRELKITCINPLIVQEDDLIIHPLIDANTKDWKVRVKTENGRPLTELDMIRAKEDFDFFSCPVKGEA